MSRYSYKVEKLLKETKSPSLDILLEEEGDDKEEPTSDESESGSEDNEEGIPDDAFASEETKDGESEEDESDESEGDEDKKSSDEESSSEEGNESLKLDVEKIKKYIASSQKAGESISDTSHKYKGISDDFFNAIDALVVKAGNDKIDRAFESKSYSGKSIKDFLFEQEEDSQANIESSIESLEKSLNSIKNQLPNPLDLAKVSYKYFDRFDKVDRAIYIIKLVSKYFKRFVNPDKDKVFDEFLDRFLNILQKNGINIELDGMQAVGYKTAVGARTAG